MKVITDSTLILWFFVYVSGILLFMTDAFLLLGIVSLTCFLTGCFFRNIPETIRNYCIFLPLFFALGLLSMEWVFPKENNNLVHGENYYLGRIELQLNTNRAWSSNLVRLEAGMTNEGKWQKTNEKVLLLTENNETLIHQNDVVLFQTTFKEIDSHNNPGEFDARMYWYSKGVRYQGFGASDQLKLIEHVPLNWFDQLLETSRNYSSEILDRWVGAKEAPLIKAILLGDKSDLDMETKRVFTNTGAMHMLAVSGMHIGLIVVLLGGIFKLLFLYRGRIIASCLMIVLLWFYAFLTGFSASVVRAVAMFTVIILAGFMRRGYQPINSLAIAGFFILLWDPMAIFDIGFQLSFLAMVGIFSVYPMLEHLVKFKQKWLNTTWQGTAIGLASQVFTVPIAVFYFNQFPNYFILTNFGVMLFSGIMLGLAIALLALGEIMIVSAPIGWFLALCSFLLVGFIAFVEMIPGALAVGFTPDWSWVIAMYLFVFVGLYWAERKKWFTILACLIPLIFWLQMDRFSNLSKQEWVVFNSNYPTILFNNGSDQICLYGGDEKGMKQAKRLVEDYQKIHPGTAEFIPISEGKYHVEIGNNDFSIELKDFRVELSHNKKRYALVTSHKFNSSDVDNDTKIIVMRNHQLDGGYDLKDGAFRCELD